ncbi:unnamed protein product [Spirodela intermedia]|uniref:Pre-mRNA-splicing factor 18 n=1 Tax=Spirodela intermedia TaxID=51605 RepID=A0A7I8JB21_SPIIN|nr:unnamed protein product [Spirodela intermedia]CAA6667299.1 unnamed protein product [Spirodela intermedia]
MDLLKRELMKKRQSWSPISEGRSSLDAPRLIRRRFKSSARRSSAKSRRNPSTTLNRSLPNLSLPPLPPGMQEASSISPPRKTLAPPPIDDLVLSKQEVIRRLRILKQPITLFGEDDEARLDRLKLTLKSGVLEIDSDMTEGQTNDFLRDIYELVSDRRRDPGVRSFMRNKDVKRMKANFEDLCGEDKILVFFKRLLNEWNQELDEMTEKEKRTAKGKSMVATFKQCARYISPLFKFCRKKVLPDDIREALLVVVNCCMKRDYLAAMDQYIKLAIGNAPWPIGVTMVGIHERSAREKIYTNSVAHIMNDETTRKYLQSVKRLMTLCQRRYPALPSKSVEFNSLANGSDLHALLSEERAKGNPISEERLRLMPVPKKE